MFEAQELVFPAVQHPMLEQLISDVLSENGDCRLNFFFL